MNQAYHVEPVIQETSTGEVVTDFSVSGSNGRIQAIEDFHANQDNYVVSDDFGNQQHMFSLQNEELSQLLEPDFEGEIIEEEDVQAAQAAEDEFYRQTVEWCGGTDNYNELTQYALQNWDSQAIDNFNAIMDGGSFEDRALAVKFLALQYYKYHNE